MEGLVCTLLIECWILADDSPVLGDNESEIMKMIAQLPKETASA